MVSRSRAVSDWGLGRHDAARRPYKRVITLIIPCGPYRADEPVSAAAECIAQRRHLLLMRSRKPASCPSRPKRVHERHNVVEKMQFVALVYMFSVRGDAALAGAGSPNAGSGRCRFGSGSVRTNAGSDQCRLRAMPVLAGRTSCRAPPIHRGFSVGCARRVYRPCAKGIELSSLSMSIGGGSGARRVSRGANYLL